MLSIVSPSSSLAPPSLQVSLLVSLVSLVPASLLFPLQSSVLLSCLLSCLFLLSLFSSLLYSTFSAFSSHLSSFVSILSPLFSLVSLRFLSSLSPLSSFFVLPSSLGSLPSALCSLLFAFRCLSHLSFLFPWSFMVSDFLVLCHLSASFSFPASLSPRLACLFSVPSSLVLSLLTSRFLCPALLSQLLSSVFSFPALLHCQRQVAEPCPWNHVLYKRGPPDLAPGSRMSGLGEEIKSLQAENLGTLVLPPGCHSMLRATGSFGLAGWLAVACSGGRKPRLADELGGWLGRGLTGWPRCWLAGGLAHWAQVD